MEAGEGSAVVQVCTSAALRLATRNTTCCSWMQRLSAARANVRLVWLNAPHYHLHVLTISQLRPRYDLRYISSLPSNHRSVPHTTSPSKRDVKLSPDRLSALLASLPSDNSNPHHNTVLAGFRQLRQLLSSFVTGTKQLLHNARYSYAIQQQLRANPALALNRADHRHLQKTRLDVLGGLLIVALFFVPIVGNIIPLLAQLFPRQLPSVFVSSVRRYELIMADVKNGLPLLLELQRHINRLQPRQLLDTTREVKEVKAAATQHLPLASSDVLRPQLLTLGDVRHPRQMLAHQALFTALPLSRFSHDHLYSLLQFHSNLLLLHSFLPATTLVSHLHTYSASVLTDDGRLVREGRGERLGVVELTEALQERGLYRGLLSRQYAEWIAGQRLLEAKGDKGKGVGDGEEEGKEADERVRVLLLEELREWLEMTEGWSPKEAVRYASLLCHTGPVVCSDLYLDGTPFAPQGAKVERGR